MSQSTTSFDADPHPIRLRWIWSRRWHAPVLVALAYYAGAEAAFYVGTLSDKIFAPFWPPNVILFCALLLAPERRWWLFIAATFPVHAIAEFGVGMPVGQMLVAFVTNCAVALLNAFIIRRLINGPPWLSDLRRASLFILVVAGVSPALAAFGGAFVPILGGGAGQDYWQFWASWYLSNVLTGLTLGPVLLIWLGENPKRLSAVPAPRMIEAAVLGFSLVAAYAVAFEISAGMVARGFLPAVLYAPLPLILWAALRFGTRGASGAILTVALVLTWRALKGPSLFLGADPETNVLALQLFLAGLAIPALLLGAAIEELHHAARTTRALAGSVLHAQDDERRRIARELHDSTGQNLIATRMLVGRLRAMVPASAGPAMDELDQTIRQSIDEVRTVSYLLHPPFLDESGLRLALAHYVDGFSQRSGIAVELHVAADVDRLPPNVELALFRVVQEALTNVSRHSGSPTARINLRLGTMYGSRGVVLSVEDSGRGIAAAVRRPGAIALRARPNNGVGLASMRERLHQLGGQLEVVSAVGRTVVTAVIPDADSGWQTPAGPTPAQLPRAEI